MNATITLKEIYNAVTGDKGIWPKQWRGMHNHRMAAWNIGVFLGRGTDQLTRICVNVLETCSCGEDLEQV
jgi:hypothetical protein